jgi:hypothetical protein
MEQRKYIKKTKFINPKGESIELILKDGKTAVIEINGQKCEYLKNEIGILAKEITRLHEDMGWN